MLNGYFENCYGLKQFNLPNINFSQCNKAMIYAPNGVMKSSLSKVFDDISKGAITSDRIFQNVISSYSITHYTSQYVSSSQNATHLMPTDRVYEDIGVLYRLKLRFCYPHLVRKEWYCCDEEFIPVLTHWRNQQNFKISCRCGKNLLAQRYVISRKKVR